ncbi:MAG: metal ABC transporter substrate-binding protein, partial [Yaniella sp.]|uniref:metal ABC transporter solute-binding protein, Zn/Mn family n=1 Tax=Yaniella sp. TaxID=2773929 RepID=UPI002648573B
MMPISRKRALTIAGTVSFFGLLLASCTAETDAVGEPADGVTVVATTTQMGSLATEITDCAGGATQVLMSPSDDPHQFEASSAQMVDMIEADLVVANGLGL